MYIDLIAPPDFSLLETRQDATSFLSLQGEFDLRVSEYVIQSSNQLLKRGPHTLVIDLRALTFMDSSGVHAVVAVARRCQQHGVSFFLIRGRGVVDKLLTLCGISSVLEILDEPEQLPGNPPLALAG